MLSTRNNRLECPKELLNGLVKTVGFIVDVSIYRHSVFHLSSSRAHLHSRIKCILKHGAKINHHVIYEQPSFAAFDVWLEESLANFTLLKVLQTRRDGLQSVYYEWAFLRNDVLFEAFLAVLRFLSTRDANLLFTVMSMEAKVKLVESHNQAMPLSGDPLLTSLLKTEYAPSDRNSPISTPMVIPSPSRVDTLQRDLHLFSDLEDGHDAVVDVSDVHLQGAVPSFSYSYQSPVSSPPQDRVHSESSSSLGVPEASSLMSLETSKNIYSPSRQQQVIPSYGSTTSIDQLSRIKSSSDEGKLGKKKAGWNKSFLESGGMVLPPAMGQFPRPQQGQTVTSFLTSLSDNLPDLDRENAHFNVSEALISAFERIKIQKYHEKMNRQQPTNDDNSDEEDVFGTVSKNPDLTKDIAPSNAKPSRRPRSRKLENFYTETEESEMEYWRQRPRRPPPYLKKKPRVPVESSEHGTVSQTSSSIPSSEDDFLSSYSAENVALNLLRNSKVSDNQLPPASELQWLVTELEAPQALLPLPKPNNASGSESDYNSGNTTESSIGRIDNHIRLRGNLDWAPPRPQIIFTVHAPASINILVKSQRCRCAGCGTRVDMKYISTFRYCHYLGRYFCTGCHTGRKARLPQMIIHQWDFSPHGVSNFAATLLEKLQSDPVYNVLAINKTIYKKVKLNNFRNLRIQLGILKEYLQNCKSATHLQGELQKFPQYYSNDVDLYSLEDLVHLRFSTGLPMKTKEFVSAAIKHVLHCELCKGLGFICEICCRDEILFPFQINRISRCSQCASCFHLRCFHPVKNSCPKCVRIAARKNHQEVHAAVYPDSTDPTNSEMSVAC